MSQLLFRTSETILLESKTELIIKYTVDSNSRFLLLEMRLINMERGKDTVNAVILAWNWNCQYELKVYVCLCIFCGFFLLFLFFLPFFSFLKIFFFFGLNSWFFFLTQRNRYRYVWMCTYKCIYTHSTYTPKYYMYLFTNSAGGLRSDTPVAISTPSTLGF